LDNRQKNKPGEPAERRHLLHCSIIIRCRSGPSTERGLHLQMDARRCGCYANTAIPAAAHCIACGKLPGFSE
jgi:hypothetical protein